jgi:hypothetical protein
MCRTEENETGPFDTFRLTHELEPQVLIEVKIRTKLSGFEALISARFVICVYHQDNSLKFLSRISADEIIFRDSVEIFTTPPMENYCRYY